MKGNPEPMESKPSFYLGSKEVPAVEGYEVGDKLTITISGTVIRKTESKDKKEKNCEISVEYSKGDCELSDEVSKKAEKAGLSRKDYKEVQSERKKGGE